MSGARRDTSNRVWNGVARATLEKTNDDPKMQEVDLNISHGEKHTGVERVQNYGFSSRPLPPSKDGDNKGRPEAVLVYPNGSRSHPLVIAIDDRRHRPKQIREGESILYDDQGQKVHLTRDGIVVESDKSITFRSGSTSIIITKDGVTITSPDVKVVKA